MTSLSLAAQRPLNWNVFVPGNPALDQAQLTETLATRDRITIFAPTDQAFAALPEAERTRLLDPANLQELRNLMLYHVLVADLRPD